MLTRTAWAGVSRHRPEPTKRGTEMHPGNAEDVGGRDSTIVPTLKHWLLLSVACYCWTGYM